MGTFYAVLQMFRRGQNYKFCHIESCGKNNATSLIKLQSTSFFQHMDTIDIVFISFCYFSKKKKKKIKILQNGALVTIAVFWLTLYH